MGLMNKLRAVGNEAGKAAKQLADDAARKSEDSFGQQNWYENVKATGQKVRDYSSKSWLKGSGAANELLGDFEKTKAAEGIGKASRKITGLLGKAPLLSVVTDVFRSVHGIDALYEHLLNDPEDPERHLWLSEAMVRMARDRQRYVAVRSTVDPAYIAMQKSVQLATSLNQRNLDPTQVRLLKNAFALSLQMLKKNPRDQRALHVISRVYLIRRIQGEATRFSKLAILADPSNGYPYVTLARTYLQLGQVVNARKTAKFAVDKKASIGNEIVAETWLAENGNDESRLHAYTRLLDQVDQDSREAYWGPSVQGLNIVEAVGAAQMKKVSALLKKP